MTFKETEYPDIIEKLYEFSQQGLPMEEIVREVWFLDRRIPLYPGIVAYCMNGMMEKTELSNVTEGQYVCMDTGSEKITGRVRSRNDRMLVLSEVTVIRKIPEKEIGTDEIKSIEIMKYNTLEKAWPSLVFDKNKKG